MFDPHLAVGQVVTEKEINKIFECQTTVGIRMSSKNNLIVLMSGSAKKKSYDDKWDGDILYYIGTDINADSEGNQTLITGHGNNNRQLKDVWTEPEKTRKSLFLFVKKESNKCIYKGPVKLIKEPYQEWRDDSRRNKVWVYPVQLMNIDRHDNKEDFQSAEQEALSMPIEILYNRIKGKEEDRLPGTVAKQHKSSALVYDRDPGISAYAKLRAGGKCDLCGHDAPFTDDNGKPYLEAHHIKWLSKGGADEIGNIVALCPNCHRKMHIVNNDEDVASLIQRIEKYKISETEF